MPQPRSVRPWATGSRPAFCVEVVPAGGPVRIRIIAVAVRIAIATAEGHLAAGRLGRVMTEVIHVALAFAGRRRRILRRIFGLRIGLAAALLLEIVPAGDPVRVA